MRKSAAVKWKIISLMLLTDFIIITQQSIAGITYHDDIGVEGKYRNVHECNPMYWHPLHLPEHCAEMFSDLIRSRVGVAANRPVRLLTRKRSDYGHPHETKLEEDIYSLRRYYKYFEPEYEQPIYETEYIYGNNNDYSMERFEHQELNPLPPYISPYERMFAFLRQDINDNPIAPTIGMSNYGPVAMYKQPISKKSEKLINKIARAYARANKVDNDDDGYYYGKIELPINNTSNNRGSKSVKNDAEMFEKSGNKKIRLRKKAKNRKHSNGLTIQ